MSIALPTIAKLVFRAMFLGTGLMALALSFFHGFDLNLLFLMGMVMIVVALIPYDITNKRMKAWGIGMLTFSLGLYLYLLGSMFQDLSLNTPVEMSDALLLLPLACMAYLLAYFFTNSDKNSA